MLKTNKNKLYLQRMSASWRKILLLGPIHTGRIPERRARKFERFSFDVACLQCGHSHSHQQVPFASRGIARPVWIGPQVAPLSVCEVHFPKYKTAISLKGEKSVRDRRYSTKRRIPLSACWHQSGALIQKVENQTNENQTCPLCQNQSGMDHFTQPEEHG